MSTPETKKTFDGTSWVLDETMKVTKIHAEAQDLSKENPTDVGYPLTLIGRSENRIEDIVGEIGYFNTGLRITPPAGYHIEIVARNGLHKTGYEIPSGLLVFNPSFNSEIIVPLRKFKEAEDLELPYQAVEILLRPSVHAYIQGPGALGRRPGAAARRNVDDEPQVQPKLAGKRGGQKGNHMF